MTYFEIINNDNFKEIHKLVSFNILCKSDCVIFTVESMRFRKTYRLYSDVNFETNEDIVNRLEKIMDNICEKNYILKIDEYFERCYVSIGYETYDKFEMSRFTAHCDD